MILLGEAWTKIKKKSIPLQDIEMNNSVEYSFVTLQICQTYKNTFQHPIENEYVFPVSSDASITSLKLQTDAGQIIEAAIEEKEEALEQYGDIVQQGNTGFMASYDQDDSEDIMVLNNGNLLQNQTVVVMITYVGLTAIEEQSQVLFIPCALCQNITYRRHHCRNKLIL